MCRDCGCSASPSPKQRQEHTHGHGSRTLVLHQSLLDRNDQQAQHNRELFASHGLIVLNLLSAPGSGKTALLERTLTDLRGRLRIGVVVGDLETENDAERLRGRGAAVVPVTTGTVCHLDSEMVARACGRLPLEELELLVIENVGNLVCPAAFDLGEEVRVVVLSTTEGEDKPLKYPPAFKSARVVLVNKVDVTDAVGFDMPQARANLRRVAPQAEVFEVSARTGQGMEAWYRYLHGLFAARRTNSSVATAHS